MEKSILQYLQTMGVIDAPTKASDTAPVEPQIPEQLLEGFFRFLLKMLTLMFAPIGLTLLGISMMPTVAKPLVLHGALFLLAGLANILEIIAAGLSTMLTWFIDMPTFAIYW
jgi:hypothetical protein